MKTPLGQWGIGHGAVTGVIVVIALLALLLAALSAMAQDSEGSGEWGAWYETDRQVLTVGDRVRLVLYVRAGGDATSALPDLPPEWGTFEVIDQHPLEPQQGRDGLVTAGKEYEITAFSVGDHSLPPLSVVVQGADGATVTLAPEPLVLTVQSVLTGPEDTELRDLKPQASLPFDWRRPLPLVGLALMVVLGSGLIAGFLMRRLRRAETDQAVAEPVDIRFPEDIAYAELHRIESLRLVQSGELKLHYSLVADCLRRYIEDLYTLPAMDRTTDELARLFRRQEFSLDISAPVIDVLRECDLVKFAKVRPPTEQARTLTRRVRDYIDRTRPVRRKTAAAEAAD